jgi:sulfate adenylyltransferase subunit 1 (EFTu-like GTPase family)
MRNSFFIAASNSATIHAVSRPASNPHYLLLQINSFCPHTGIKTQPTLVFDSYGIDRATGSFIVIDEATNNTVAAGMIV